MPTALDFPGVDETEMPNLAGDLETAKVDIRQMPYNNFILLWVPQRRFVRRRQVRIA